MQKIKGKKVLTFGDSIIDGHLYKKAGFMEFVAEQEGMSVKKYANNGACILPGNPIDEAGLGGMVLSDQVEKGRQKTSGQIILFLTEEQMMRMHRFWTCWEMSVRKVWRRIRLQEHFEKPLKRFKGTGQRQWSFTLPYTVWDIGREMYKKHCMRSR